MPCWWQLVRSTDHDDSRIDRETVNAKKDAMHVVMEIFQDNEVVNRWRRRPGAWLGSSPSATKGTHACRRGPSLIDEASAKRWGLTSVPHLHRSCPSWSSFPLVSRYLQPDWSWRTLAGLSLFFPRHWLRSLRQLEWCLDYLLLEELGVGWLEDVLCCGLAWHIVSETMWILESFWPCDQAAIISFLQCYLLDF